jgi:ferredoxin
MPWLSRQARRVEFGPPEVRVAVDHCVGCLACVDVCQPDALRLMPGAWAVAVDSSRCNGCRRCVTACPFGVITVSGAPRTRHQLVLDNLRSVLTSQCPAGWRVYTAGTSIGATLGQSLLMPDLAVVRDELSAEPWPPHQPATVALVVEVVSPSTRGADLGRKRDVYREQGVPTYWTVDQRDAKVTVHWSTHPAWFDHWGRSVPEPSR